MKLLFSNILSEGLKILSISLVVAILIHLFAEVHPPEKPQFYVEGKGYRTELICIEDAYIMEDSVQKLICVEYRTDTIEVK